jgi:hypothetical protein
MAARSQMVKECQRVFPYLGEPFQVLTAVKTCKKKFIADFSFLCLVVPVQPSCLGHGYDVKPTKITVP